MQSLIESYVNNELSPSERLAFEEQLKNSTQLQQETEEMRVLIAALNRKRLMNTLIDAEKMKTQQRWRLWIFGAVAFLMVGFVLFWMVKNQPKPEPQKLENAPAPTEMPSLEKDHSEQVLLPVPTETMPHSKTEKSAPIAEGKPAVDPQKTVFRSLPSSENFDVELIELAEKYLKAFTPYEYVNMAGLNTSWENSKFEDYYNTLQVLDEKNKVKEPSPSVQLVRSACLLHLHRPVAAAQILYTVIQKDDSLKNDAKYLLSISYVMQGKVDSARSALSGISGKYMSKSRALNAELPEE